MGEASCHCDGRSGLATESEVRQSQALTADLPMPGARTRSEFAAAVNSFWGDGRVDSRLDARTLVASAQKPLRDQRKGSDHIKDESLPLVPQSRPIFRSYGSSHLTEGEMVPNTCARESPSVR
jgi:hypothetical protein